jgi:GH43 family beta-xylosidase
MPHPSVTLTYTNPVYAGYFADPFVWQHRGEYYAVGTGPVEAGGNIEEAEEAASAMLGRFRIFPLLHSDDFVNWRHVIGALEPPDPELGDTFWAPEVAFNDGTFYLYYSVGHEDKSHQLRVAKSTHPLGPYIDSGTALVNPRVFPFTIDAHPFQDDDGQWYLFYARDFLDFEGNARAGTALVVDRMTDMITLAGEPRTVARARYDWQRFLIDRTMYDRVWDWHTLEGPSVVKHEGRYYCFYSGGRWETDNYGVDYCVADHPMGPWNDSGLESGPRVLKTVPHQVLGPGHNSIIRGPDHKTDYMAYHAWDPLCTARRMFIDRLVWTPDGPRCEGPTWTPQTVTRVLSRQDLL